MSDPLPVVLRAATPGDAEGLLAVYGPYVKKTAVTFEYEIPGVEEFQGRIARTLEKYPYLVAESGGRPLGYAYAGVFNERPACDWSVETSIYVDMERKRCGVGRLLYSALEKALAAQGIVNLNACIAASAREDPYLTRNSLDFHARMGYRTVGEFHQCGFKFGRWYSLVWMEKHIGHHSPDMPPVKTFAEVRGALEESGVLSPGG